MLYARAPVFRQRQKFELPWTARADVGERSKIQLLCVTLSSVLVTQGWETQSWIQTSSGTHSPAA